MDLKIVLFAFFIIILTVYAYESYIIKEHFDATDYTDDIASKVNQMYTDLLKRQPTSQELVTASRDISSGKITFKQLKRRILDTDEYQLTMKMQSNELAPELPKMLSDKEMITSLGVIYTQETSQIIPSKIVLPMRDLYIYFDYSDGTIRALLRDAAYPNFESDLINTPNLDNPTLIDMLNTYFNVDTLRNIGASIDLVQNTAGASPDDKLPRSLNDTDTDMTPMVNSIMTATATAKTTPIILYDANGNQVVFPPGPDAKGNPSGTLYDQNGNIVDPSTITGGMTVFDANGNALSTSINVNELTDATPDSLNNYKINYVKVQLPTHQDDMVLMPELAWSVPNYRPPVCTTIGKEPLVQPVFSDTNSRLLLGTPLDQAANNTAVGSIMPKFTFKEYVYVPV